MTGRVLRVEGNAAEVEVGDRGLVYEVLLPGYEASRVAGLVGQEVTLHTREHLEAIGQGTAFVPRMLGFASASDRRFFEVFTSVKGLGLKKGLRALAMPPGEVAGAIVRRDAKALQALPEIGKRLAETIVAELSGKVDAFALGDAERAGLDAAAGGAAPTPAGGLSGGAQQAVKALVTLGENPADAERMVRDAVQANADLTSADEILAAVYAAR